MKDIHGFKVGEKIKFNTPRGSAPVIAEVTGISGKFVVTKDAVGKERKAFPGACSRVQ